MSYENNPVKIGLAVALAVFIYNFTWLIFWGNVEIVLPFSWNFSFNIMRFFEVFTIVTLASWVVLGFTKGTFLRIIMISGLVLAFELPPLTLHTQDVMRGLFYLIAISIAVNIFGRTKFKGGEYSSSRGWTGGNN